jgi:hypothetical protein
VGRLGAAGSPILAGALFDWFGEGKPLAATVTTTLPTVAIIMALGSVLSAVLFMMLPIRDADAEAVRESTR